MTKDRLIYLLVTLNVTLLAFMGFRETGKQPQGFLTSAAQAAQTPPPAATTATLQRPSEIVLAAQKASPAVVSVGASQSGYFVSPYANFFSEYTVYPYQEKVPYLGSGVIIDPEGYIITNYHVVEGANDVFVTLMDGRELPAKLLDADVVLDIALLKVDAKALPSIELGDSDALQVGEWVLALGNPFGNLIEDPHPTVTAGVVSAVKRSFRPGGNVQRVYMDMIQTDAAINPGNSGGALVNGSGQLVGMNTFIMSRSGGAEGIGFAVPVNRIKAVVNEIRAHGRVRSPAVDFQVQNLTPRIARMVDSTSSKGAVVSEINRGGSAERAGLKLGDVIVGVDDRNVKDAQDVKLYVWTKQVGQKATLDVERQGKRLKIDYELGEAPRGLGRE